MRQVMGSLWMHEAGHEVGHRFASTAIGHVENIDACLCLERFADQMAVRGITGWPQLEGDARGTYPFVGKRWTRKCERSKANCGALAAPGFELHSQWLSILPPMTSANLESPIGDQETPRL